MYSSTGVANQSAILSVPYNEEAEYKRRGCKVWKVRARVSRVSSRIVLLGYRKEKEDAGEWAAAWEAYMMMASGTTTAAKTHQLTHCNFT